MKEQYKPTEGEIKKAEEMMDGHEKKLSDERAKWLYQHIEENMPLHEKTLEHLKEVRDAFKRVNEEYPGVTTIGFNEQDIKVLEDELEFYKKILEEK